LTDHWLFCCCRPKVASSIDDPSSSTGPRMYFAEPSASHVMSGWSAGALAGSLEGFAQS